MSEDTLRVHRREPQTRERNHRKVPIAVQESRRHPFARSRTATEQGMDEYQRDELCGEVAGDAAYACV